MNCENCNATLTPVGGQNYHRCDVCQSYQFPTDIESAEDSIKPTGKLTAFQCPKCKQALEVGSLRGMVDVCFCPNCRGYVIDSETLGSLVNELRQAYQGPDDTPRPLDSRELDQPVVCPACRETMDAHPYYGPGNSVLDSCIHCKLAWFDHGELARIVRAPGLRPGAVKVGS